MSRFIFIVTSLFCLLLSSNAASQDPAEISGHAPELEGKTVWLYGYADGISQHKELLDSTTVKTDGEFELSFDCTEIRYVQIVSDYIGAHLYVEPATWYDVEFPIPGKESPRNFGRKAKTEVIFNNLELEDINALIIDFNYNYEVFFQSNYNLLRGLFSPRNYSTLNDTFPTPQGSRGKLKKLFEASKRFAVQMDSVYLGYDKPYFALYRSAVMGDLLMNSPATPREIYESYIEPFAFEAQHVEFSRLHERFYKHYFARYSQSYGDEDLNLAINEEGNLATLRILLTKDDFAADSERKDAIILLAIKELWASNSMDHEKMAKILATMIENGSTAQIQGIAETLHAQLTACKKGMAPKDIEFEDAFKDRQSIARLSKEGPVLIEFWADWCTQCQAEREHLLTLMDRYGKHIKVVSVEVTEDAMQSDQLRMGAGYTLTSCHPESQWIQDYQVLSLPHYVLLDREGKVQRDQCPMPSSGLEAIFHRIKESNRRAGKRGIGGRDN